MTYYLIYKITNNLNGKFYIGQHKTENINDGYMGSGLNIRRAIIKYGIENFTKEILYFCTDLLTMNMVEEMLVNEEFIAREDTYNIALGGRGGKYGIVTEETRKRMSVSQKKRIRKPMSIETREMMSESAKRRWARQKLNHIN